MEDKKTLRLIKQATRGNDRAFLELMKTKRKDLLYIAIQIMRNQQDGEDAAQESALLIREKIHELRSPEAFSVWMYRIVFSVCMTMKRKMKQTPQDIQELFLQETIEEDRQEFLPLSSVLDHETQRQVLDAVATLPDKQRTCVVLFYYEGLKYVEIAEVLGTNVQDVANTLSRAKKKMREFLSYEEELTLQPAAKHGIVAVPIVTMVLQADARDTITPEICRAFDQSLSEALALSLVSTGTALFKAKVAALVVTGFVLIAGGTWAVSQIPMTAPDITPATEDQDYLSKDSAEKTTEDNKPDEDFTIDKNVVEGANPDTEKSPAEDERPQNENGWDNTLPSSPDSSNKNSDGSDDDTGKTPTDPSNPIKDDELSGDEWEEAISQLQAKYYTHIVGTQFRYDVYIVTFADTSQQLTVIARVDANDQVVLASRYQDTEEIPRQKDIVRAFEEWRE